MIIVRILVQGPFEDGLDYLYPFSHPVLYTRVLVPLGKRKLIGIISQINPDCAVTKDKLKQVIKVLDCNAIVSNRTIVLINWLSTYYQCSLYQALKLAIPKLLLQKEQAFYSEVIEYRLANSNIKLAKNAHKQNQLIELLKQRQVLNHSELIKLGVLPQTLKALLNKSAIQKYVYPYNPFYNTQRQTYPKTLTTEQQKIVSTISTRLDYFNTILLYGVTGSGKTEIYIETIKPIVEKGGQVLILVPEINLTPQTLNRFQNRLTQPMAVIHSQLTDQARLDVWLHAKEGNINIIIATRIGLFFDLPKLKMIIVDEEHDASYKQQNIPNYHARDVAIMKAQKFNVPILLGSGTPSLESYHHAISNKYHLISLKKRALNQTQNTIHIINMQKQQTVLGLSQVLIDKIQQVIAKGEQALLFINRRGFAHSLICQACGWCANCNHCQKPYTLHKKPQHLACHFCGKAKEIITECPNCKSHNLIDFGNGTEKLEDQLMDIFPYANVARLDRSSTQRKGELEAQLNNIKSNHIDIIVGTQMITKGHDFQHVTLVGVINADAGFYSQDFHAIEKTAQLITQVAGRTGRGNKSGEVYIQTYQPDNSILHLILQKHYEQFLHHALETRKLLNYPPFSYQAYIYAQATKTEMCTYALQKLYHSLSHYNLHYQFKCDISPVLPAINIKQAGYYRFMLMLTAKNRSTLQKLLKSIKHEIATTRKKVKITVDIDPIEIK
ncbi:replication restart helicase PriA [Fastidiosibacter lacustris]|uniref:replication restart helicase PriA n=1 Tax=Fastidiosibacter lacustris TaxID=2056695 RepID=UPI000E356A01|nr:primosomal protein N' [Fastidiosibacter lacustris]